MGNEVKMSRNVSIQQIRQNSPANQSSQEVKNTETQEIDVSVRDISSNMWGNFKSHINNSHKDKKIPPPPPPKSSMPPVSKKSSSTIQAGDKTEVKRFDEDIKLPTPPLPPVSKKSSSATQAGDEIEVKSSDKGNQTSLSNVSTDSDKSISGSTGGEERVNKAIEKESYKEKLKKEIDELIKERKAFKEETGNNYKQNQIEINKINNDIKRITTFLENNINAKGKEIEDKKKEMEVLENQKKKLEEANKSIKEKEDSISKAIKQKKTALGILNGKFQKNTKTKTVNEGVNSNEVNESKNTAQAETVSKGVNSNEVNKSGSTNQDTATMRENLFNLIKNKEHPKIIDKAFERNFCVSQENMTELNNCINNGITQLRMIEPRDNGNYDVDNFEDKEEWADYFYKLSKDIDKEDIKLEDKFNKKLTLSLHLYRLYNECNNIDKKARDNRHYFFNEDIANRTYEAYNMNFLGQYKENLTNDFKNGLQCIEFGNNKMYIIEKINGNKEHDNRMIRSLQNLVPNGWCTKYKTSCLSHLGSGDSYLIIPQVEVKEGERIMRIQTETKGNLITINSVTDKENHHDKVMNSINYINDENDVKNLIGFVEKMEEGQDSKIIAMPSYIFNFNGLGSKASESLIEYYEKLFEKKPEDIKDVNGLLKLLSKVIHIDLNTINQIAENNPESKIADLSKLLRGEKRKDKSELPGLEEFKRKCLEQLEKIINETSWTENAQASVVFYTIQGLNKLETSKTSEEIKRSWMFGEIAENTPTYKDILNSCIAKIKSDIGDVLYNETENKVTESLSSEETLGLSEINQNIESIKNLCNNREGYENSDIGKEHISKLIKQIEKYLAQIQNNEEKTETFSTLMNNISEILNYGSEIYNKFFEAASELTNKL